jgi:MFS family permease
VTRPGLALFLGASAMFANMYPTQAILPDVERGLHASPAAAGLTITVVVLAVALGGWVTGPLSDRLGRARVMAASAASQSRTSPSGFAGRRRGPRWGRASLGLSVRRSDTLAGHVR